MEIRSTDLETERCLLRDWTCDDEPRVLDIYSRWEVARWLGADPKPMEGPEQAARFVESCNALNHEDPVARRWAVERRDDGVVLGTVILVQLPEPSAESGFPDGRYEVGWHFHPDSWGHGYATETARAAITWGFGHGLEEIFAVVRPDNTASLNVCKRLDMREHGRTGAYYGTELELFSTARADQR